MSEIIINGDQIIIIDKGADLSKYEIKGRVSGDEHAVIVSKKALIQAIRLDASRFELRQGETWRDVVARVGSAQGVMEECLAEFNDYMTACPEDGEKENARAALLDWDALI